MGFSMTTQNSTDHQYCWMYLCVQGRKLLVVCLCWGCRIGVGREEYKNILRGTHKMKTFLCPYPEFPSLLEQTNDLTTIQVPVLKDQR